MKAKFLTLAIVLGFMSVPAFGDTYIFTGTVGPSFGTSGGDFVLTTDVGNLTNSNIGFGFYDYALSLTVGGTSIAVSPFDFRVVNNRTLFGTLFSDWMEANFFVGSTFHQFLFLFPIPTLDTNVVLPTALPDPTGGFLSPGLQPLSNLSVTVVPEPATLPLLAAGLLAGAAFRKRFK